MILVTLLYSDSSSWFAGGFPSMEAANAWIATEKTRPYWDENTQIQITDNSEIQGDET